MLRPRQAMSARCVSNSKGSSVVAVITHLGVHVAARALEATNDVRGYRIWGHVSDMSHKVRRRIPWRLKFPDPNEQQ